MTVQRFGDAGERRVRALQVGLAVGLLVLAALSGRSTALSVQWPVLLLVLAGGLLIERRQREALPPAAGPRVTARAAGEAPRHGRIRRLWGWLQRQISDGVVHGHNEGERCNELCRRTAPLDDPPRNARQAWSRPSPRCRARACLQARAAGAAQCRAVAQSAVRRPPRQLVTSGASALLAALAFAVVDCPAAPGGRSRRGAGRRSVAGPAGSAPDGVGLCGCSGRLPAPVGLMLYALAVRGGQVVVMQPLLVRGLPLSIAAGAVLERTWPSRAQVVAALLAAAGLALFLLSAPPQPGTALGRTDVLWAASAGVLLVLVAAVRWGRRPNARHRALLLGLAAGSGFGVTGVLLKQVVDTPTGQLLRTWPVIALLAVGVPSVVVAQWAFQSGSLSSCLPAVTMVEPVVAVVLGALGFSEQLSTTALGRAGQLVGLLSTLARSFDWRSCRPSRRALTQDRGHAGVVSGGLRQRRRRICT